MPAKYPRHIAVLTAATLVLVPSRPPSVKPFDRFASPGRSRHPSAWRLGLRVVGIAASRRGLAGKPDAPAHLGVGRVDEAHIGAEGEIEAVAGDLPPARPGRHAPPHRLEHPGPSGATPSSKSSPGMIASAAAARVAIWSSVRIVSFTSLDLLPFVALGHPEARLQSAQRPALAAAGAP